jgi:pyochelin biosynthetic protein PchC
VPVSIRSIAAPQRTSLRRFGASRQQLTRLVAFPWCGAGASVYRRLAPHLPDHIELVGVQLPGREDRYDERRLVRMQDVVEEVIGDLIGLLDRPMVLFGHSMGALVAYEVAVALRERAGCEPASLIVSGHGAPHCAKPSGRCWHTADETAFIANIRALGGTPRALLENASVLRAFMPTMRADFEVVETYRPAPRAPLSCPLLACAGDRDDEVSNATMNAWLRYTTGHRELHWFGGDHFYLSSQPAVLASRLAEWVTPGALIGNDMWDQAPALQ